MNNVEEEVIMMPVIKKCIEKYLLSSGNIFIDKIYSSLALLYSFSQCWLSSVMLEPGTQLPRDPEVGPAARPGPDLAAAW